MWTNSAVHRRRKKATKKGTERESILEIEMKKNDRNVLIEMKIMLTFAICLLVRHKAIDLWRRQTKTEEMWRHKQHIAPQINRVCRRIYSSFSCGWMCVCVKQCLNSTFIIIHSKLSEKSKRTSKFEWEKKDNRNDQKTNDTDWEEKKPNDEIHSFKGQSGRKKKRNTN